MSEKEPKRPGVIKDQKPNNSKPADVFDMDISKGIKPIPEESDDPFTMDEIIAIGGQMEEEEEEEAKKKDEERGSASTKNTEPPETPQPEVEQKEVKGDEEKK